MNITSVQNKSNPIDISDYFSHQRPFTNLKLILNNQTIWCDKASLSAASPIIREQLLQSPHADFLVFQDINPSDFLSILEFIYPIFNPQINEKNIASLINLADRFQFDMLEHACQTYVMKYLSTIERVFKNSHHHEAEGDYLIIDKQHDYLIQFHNQICIDAYKITVDLCRWLKIYYQKKTTHQLVIQSIISVLQQISVDYLEQAMTMTEIDENLKGYIYQQRAQYLEQVQHLVT